MSSRDEQAGLILLVEDNRQIAEMVGEFLERRGYSVDYAADGVSGLHLAVSNSYDVVVLDLMLPGMDGLDVCRKLRRDAKKSTPVLMLTARDTLEDKLVGLEAGADDYLVKPFDLEELAARIRSALRRSVGHAEPEMEIHGVRINPASREVTRNGHPVALSAREYAIVEALMLRPGAILSRAQLEQRMYGWGEEVESNAVEVHIHAVRRKLGVDFIQNMRGVGYFIPKAEQAS